ncbi:MAG: type II secretion system protein [Candidatus Cryosericum sp.]
MKRRGFTLIELMVVIAIIIILAAIAIPNYLNMTKRAKNSRLASDMATLATALETFKTDWGKYPVVSSGKTAEAVNLPDSNVYKELSGVGCTDSNLNGLGKTNAIGETNPGSGNCIEYIKAGTLQSITNPFGLPSANSVMYKSDAAGAGQTWTLYAQTDTSKWLVRTSNTSTAVETASQP